MCNKIQWKILFINATKSIFNPLMPNMPYGYRRRLATKQTRIWWKITLIQGIML